MKKLTLRLSTEIEILTLRFAMGLCYVAMAGDVLHRKCLSLSKRIRERVMPPEAEEPFVYVPSPIDGYTLDLTAWRGDDGEGLTQFAVTPKQAESITTALGNGKNNVPVALPVLLNVLHAQEAA